MRTIFKIMLTTLVLLTIPMVSAEYNTFYLAPDGAINCDNPGDDVTAWVMVNTSNDVNAFQASIIFDPNIVSITAEGGDINWMLWEYLIGDFGDKKYISLRGADPANTYGPGELQLGKITLHGEANGVCPLHFGNTSELGRDRTELSNTSGMICNNELTMLDGTFACGAGAQPQCLGTCYVGTCEGALVGEMGEMNCSECLKETDRVWKPNMDTACFGDETPSDLYLDWCPECCDGDDDDTDTDTDYPADAECTCGLDLSEAVPMNPIPELSTFLLTSLGILSLVLLTRKRD